LILLFCVIIQTRLREPCGENSAHSAFKIGLQNKHVHSEMGIAFSEYFTGPFSGIVF